MKKILTGIATLIAFVVVFFGAAQPVRAENADRANNKEARAIKIRGVDQDNQPVPLNSYNSEFTVYLLPGENLVLSPPSVPGYSLVELTGKSLTTGNELQTDPTTEDIVVSYEDLPAQDTLFAGDGASGKIQPSWEVTIHFQLNEGATAFYKLPVAGYEEYSKGDSSEYVAGRLQNAATSNIPFDGYFVFARDGETIPLKNRTKSGLKGFHGMAFFSELGGKTSEIFTTNQKLDVSQFPRTDVGNFYVYILTFFNDEPATANDMSANGYWEAFSFASIPGNEDYVNGVEVPGGVAAQEPADEEEVTDNSSTEDNSGGSTSTKEAKPDNSGAAIVAFAVLAVIGGAIFFFAKKKK